MSVATGRAGAHSTPQTGASPSRMTSAGALPSAPPREARRRRPRSPDLRRLGAKQVIATDGYLSPLLGTHGDLAISTDFALDPIQRYGLMARPE